MCTGPGSEADRPHRASVDDRRVLIDAPITMSLRGIVKHRDKLTFFGKVKGEVIY
jgi:hypothetical protein